MIRAGLLLILLLVAAPAAAESPSSRDEFDADLAADVFAAALDFIAPRILVPATVEQLALRGLRGLTALDPELVATLDDGRVQLIVSGRMLFDGPAPAAKDAEDWSDLIADVADVAWSASMVLRRADTQEIIVSFFDELFAGVDPYSRYVPPAEAEIEAAQRAGEAGIGIVVVPRRGWLEITRVAPEGPAAAARLRPGERILAVNGTKASARAADEAIAELSGAANTPVALTIRRRDGAIREISILRAVLPPETVFAKRRADMLVLRIGGFNGLTARHLEYALVKALAAAHRPRGIVLDLRGNRGGPLEQAAEVAGAVLGTGLVATTVGRYPAANRVLQADAVDLSGGLPVVVLVDGGTASTAEIVAAALADDRRAVVVGSATQGKGLTQTVTSLPDGGELFVSWSNVFAPLGWPIQGLGVMPQVCTSLGESALQRQLASLAEGQEPMEKALLANRTAPRSLPSDEILAIRNACPAAEGGEADFGAAQFLIRHPAAYVTALLPPQLLPSVRAGSP